MKKKFRLMLKGVVGGTYRCIHSIVLESDFAPSAQEIFNIFDKDGAANRPRLFPKTFEEAWKSFSFEAYELPDNFKE